MGAYQTCKIGCQLYLFTSKRKFRMIFFILKLGFDAKKVNRRIELYRLELYHPATRQPGIYSFPSPAFFISFLNSMVNMVQVVATATASATGSARNTAKTLSVKK